MTYLERLHSELSAVKGDLDQLLDCSSIRNVNPNTTDSPLVFLGAADWGWEPSDSAVSAMQMRLTARYAAWFERFQLLFSHATPDIESRIQELDAFVRRWIARPDGWDHSIPPTIREAKERSADQFDRFRELLDLTIPAGAGVVRLVPDTNALIQNPDLGSYSSAASTTSFYVHLLPTVLSELDDLKDRGKSQDLRTQAQAVVRRLKGLRDKGTLAAGVKLTRNITIQAEAREVDVRAVLDWLDPSVADDRIIAAALRLQSDHPADSVVLVTSDLNLQNKADVVALPYAETPPPTSTLRAHLVAVIEWPSPDGVPEAVLTNEGPAAARGVTYSVASPPESGPPHFTAGPWSVDQLRSGASDRR